MSRDRFTTAAVLVGLLLLATATADLDLDDGNFNVRDYGPPEIINGIYQYRIFQSATETDAPVDGPSGVGRFCRPGIQAALLRRGNLVISDTCGGGSAIRVVNGSGITTIAGSLTDNGYEDGPGKDALFAGAASGNQNINGLANVNGNIYMADTENHAIRRITPDGVTSTFISPDFIYNDKTMEYPNYVEAFVKDTSTTELYISDAGNDRILYTPVFESAGTPIVTQVVQVDSPGNLAVGQLSGVMYYVSAYTTIYGTSLTGTGANWKIGPDGVFLNSLFLSNDGKMLMFYGVYDDPIVPSMKRFGIYGLDTTGSPGAAETVKPQMIIDWTDRELGEDPVQNVMLRDAVSWFIVTNRNVYIVSTEEVTDSSSGSGSGGSSGDPDAWKIGRYHGYIAFPTSAVPSDAPCYMSQLYYWMRVDAEIAYDTNDFYTHFAPLDDNSKVVYGDRNVSTWCGNITARKSSDGSIMILDFWGPKGLNMWLTQKALADSPWYWTRLFLRRLREGPPYPPPFPGLGEWCFYNCTDTCDNMTASNTHCVDYVDWSGCNDVCKGAIASSVVMGSALLGLLIILVLSPAMLFPAIFMVPIV